MRHNLRLLAFVLPLLAVRAPAADVAARVTPVPDGVRAEFKLAAHYQKFTSACGLPIVGSANVNDAALLEARLLILQMLGHRGGSLAARSKP